MSAPRPAAAPAAGSGPVTASTIVPTPESVNSSSSSAWGTRPSRMWARLTPARTARAQASTLGIMPPCAPPLRMISSITSSDALRITVVGSSATMRSPSMSVRKISFSACRASASAPATVSALML